MKTLAIGPDGCLIKKERSLEKKPDFSVGCLKRLQRCCGDHLMADTTWDQKLLNLTQRLAQLCALRIVFWDCWRQKHPWDMDESEHPPLEDNGTDQIRMYHGVVFRWFNLYYTKLAELPCRILEAMISFGSLSCNSWHKGYILIIYSTFVVMALKKMLQVTFSSCFSINSFSFTVFEAFKSKKKEFIFMFHRLTYLVLFLLLWWP